MEYTIFIGASYNPIVSLISLIILIAVFLAIVYFRNRKYKSIELP
jgi:uncharacterized membrane-anchored protein